MTILPDSNPHSTPDSSPPDIQVEDHFSLYLARPLSGRARAWLEENVQPDALWFRGAVVVEPRYLPALVEGMLAVGLTVGDERGRVQR